MQTKAAQVGEDRAKVAEAKATDDAKQLFIAQRRLEDANTNLKQLQQRFDIKSKELYDIQFERKGGDISRSGVQEAKRHMLDKFVFCC
jgi:hypothetical protein